MKKIIAILLASLFVFSLAACSDNDGSLESYLQQNGLDSDSGALTTPPQGGSTEGDASNYAQGGLAEYIPEGGDVIPEALVGDWSYVEIYQWAQASDIDVDEAITREKGCGVHITYISFYRYGESFSDPVYKTKTDATYDDMAGFGIDPSGLKELYGADASITSVTVCTPEGQACTTVFLINDATLIAFGQGMNVFMYEPVEAVG